MSVREREVTFYSDGHKIAAVLFDPTRQERAGPGLVLCQGLGGIGRAYRFPQTARTFAAAGYTCLIFDYRGFGESEGPRDRLWPEEQLDDVRNALSYVASLPGVDEQRLGLWATSYGGAHVLQALAVDERVRCGVSIVGVSHGERWLHSIRRYWEWHALLNRIAEDRQRRVHEGRSAVLDRDEVMLLDPVTAEMRQRQAELSPDLAKTYPPLRLTLESVEKIIAYRPEELLARARPRPLLLIHTADDVLVPVDQALGAYACAGEPKRLVLLPGHHFSVYLSPLYEQVTQLSLDWLREHLLV